jgi:large conductance mechanosensitive channel
MSFLNEFKEFAVRGNVLDLAVGVIIGAAFSKIVDAFIADLIMPVIGALFGKPDFSQWFMVLGEAPIGTPMVLDALQKVGVPVFAYGHFLSVLLNFFILAFAIFLLIKGVNRLRKPSQSNEAPISEEVQVLREIRDALVKQSENQSH